jgi:3',5'-cyclic AMP phosphodiesterase CpdA
MADSTPRTVIAQLSDPHLRVEEPHRGEAFAAAIARVAALDPQPAAVLVTGDISDFGQPGGYAQAAQLLSVLGPPVHVIPGNHDDRAQLRAAFGTPGTGDDQIRFTVDAGPLRIINCDTIIPGQIDGRLDVEWVEEQLALRPERPTVIAMHHPPSEIGLRSMDGNGLPPATRRAMADLLARSPQVLRVVTGHVHRASFGVAGGVPVATAPSVNFQLELDLAGDRMEPGDDPPGFLIHVLVGDRLVTHVQPV